MKTYTKLGFRLLLQTRDRFKTPRRTTDNSQLTRGLRLFSLVLFSLSLLLARDAIAQQPQCQPPRTGEYLLLVVTPTPELQQLVRRTLPQTETLGVCRYIGDTVTRVGGFGQLEAADRWGRFVRTISGLDAVVVRPAVGTAPVAASPVAGYNPQPLGQGYAVLVDFFNRPDVANSVRQTLGRDVGLVSYFSRPYLLAIYTADEREANATLRQLSDRGFSALVVDSSRAVLLTPAVNY
ncbi:MAG: hypothetical protein SW833_16900 [Cyanobacteriota bacterium]|nr:hypothetical protein [Cyanobacteriota bacterium]